LSRKISGFTLSIDKLLRANGSDLAEEIKISLDAEEFVNGEIPAYNIIFTKDGIRTGKVIEKGSYTVTIEFVDSSYYTTQVSSFQVYGEEDLNKVNVFAIVVVLLITLSGIAILSINITRKRNKKNIEKEKLKKTSRELGAKDAEEALKKTRQNGEEHFDN
jgi:hypothetical protein